MTSFETLVRGEAPLLDAYLAALDADTTPFTIPGHKRSAEFGRVVAGDVPLHGGLDSISLTGGVLVEAERRAAALWGADVARFSVGGSTHGNQALALAVGRPGDRVVVPRTLHRSLLLGLVLAGLEPVWLPTRVDPVSGLPLGCRRADVEQCLRDHPDVVAVFVGDPTYVGTVGELAAVADLVHAAGLPLLVDAAWGAHFGFHPALPTHALQAGADALVTSAHKMLPAYSQAALVLARIDRLDPARLQSAFDATHTTSPAGALLASIDAARALLQLDGEAQLDRPVRLVAAARARLREVAGLTVLEAAEATRAGGRAGRDRRGRRGRRAASCGRPGSRSSWRTATGSSRSSPSPTPRTRSTGLVVALLAAVARHPGPPRETVVAASWSVRPEIVMPPRDAFFARATTLGVDEAVGRVSAELVAPYPPGVPVLAPGERITAEAVASLQAAARAGTRIAYAADPTMATLRVVA